MGMFNLNGVWVDAEAIRVILALPNEEPPRIHISLDSGATYDIPGETGVAIEETAAKFADAVAQARMNASSSLLPPQQMNFEDIVASGARQIPLGGDMEVQEPETQRDLRNEKYYGSGWRDALREVRLQKLNDTLDIFLDEAINDLEPGDNPEDGSFGVPDQEHPWDKFPAIPPLDEIVENLRVSRTSTLEDPYPGNPAAHLPSFRSAEDGTITMNYGEFQEELANARKEGLTDTRRTTFETLQRITQETIANAGGQPPNSLTFLCRVLPRLGYQIDNLPEEQG